MKNKILLINPKGFNSEWIPQVGLFYIGTILQKYNYDVRIFDCNFIKFDIFNVLEKENPSVVGISCLSPGYGEAVKIANFAKERIGAITVLGGVHVSIVKKEILQNPLIDFAIIEEGEYSFLQLINAINNKSSVENIPGLCFRRNGAIVVNDNYHISDLDELPFPNYGLGNINRIFFYPLITSRGCPHSCIFCSECRPSNKKWRGRSVENIIDEIVFAQRQYSPKEFYVIDDNFSLDINRAKEFCIKLIEKKININWMVNTGLRANNTDRELFSLMRKSGCKKVTFGVESADEEVFKYLKKGETLEDIKNAIKWAKEAGIDTVGFFIIGLPYATFDSEKKSLDFFKRFKLNSVIYSIAFPCYGTELYDWVKSHATLLKEPVNNPFVLSLDLEPFFEMEYFRKEQIRKAFIVCNLRVKKYFINRGIRPHLYSILKIIKLSCKYDIIYLPFHVIIFAQIFLKEIYQRIYRTYFRKNSIYY